MIAVSSHMGGVKNRAAAPIQITAEQLLREAGERKIDGDVKAPRQQITDVEELTLFRQRKRKEFEDAIRMQRQHMGTWMKYANWEESQKEFERARSVYERALTVDYKYQPLWLAYAEMEMRNKFVNHARNIWDRAVTLLPRVAKFWLKYTYMEEIMGETAKARSVFERWMDWQPDEQAWMAFIKFEERRGDSVQAPRNVFMRYVDCSRSQRSYLKWAQWEEKGGHMGEARGVYERSLSELDHEEISEKLFIHFAQFEERSRETARARVIYQYALKQLPRELAPELYRNYIRFEKKHGTAEGVEEVVTEKRRAQYNEAVVAKPMNYDGWFDLIRLEESQTALPEEDKLECLSRIREVYERAVANVPPILEKRYWRHYIYLWISYAVFEELDAEDSDRAKKVLEACLEIIPHKKFTFAKVWLHLAKLEIRCGNLTAARIVMGRAIGTSPKKKIFTGYIEFELQMGEVDRCRKIYTKYLEWAPESCEAWLNYAKLERDVGEEERTRALYELSIGPEEIDMPEVLWKAYIDFETEQGETARARALYERLLEKTKHVKVWVTYGDFEADCGDEKAMRAAFRRGYDSLKEQGLKEERVLLLDTWRGREKKFGDEGVKMVDAMMPRRFKKKRMVTDESGEEVAWEELYDYVFPDETDKPSNLKILEMAQKWKASQAAKEL